MCEIFPEVDSCCGVASIRVGMLLIAVLSITTGALSLGVIEQRSNFNYKSVFKMYKDASNFTSPDQAVSSLSHIISTCIAFISFSFMIGGIALLFSTLSDQEGFAQMFVWLVFLNIFIGFMVVIAVSYECIYGSNECVFGNMDWLSASTCTIVMVSYLFLWYYFCCVANSYVLNAHA
ncbi:hypothetical protein PYW07_009987 [Mythimna separata]|uniref:Uncharacterized protein n=1 Tax=Mythimna separata TaxID=271217 RepID=A0AAD8DR64_MYTSE|nr:hypothetical protein PYW07_009987 [Mythimna separata]